MNIAFILPALRAQGPVLVVSDIVEYLNTEPGVSVTVFYFDSLAELTLPVPTIQIKPKERYDFSGFDIIHTHGIRPDRYVYIHRKHLRATCISTTHNIIFEEYRVNHNFIVALGVQFLWARFLGRHDVIVSLTREMKQYYTRLLPKKDIRVIYNGRGIKAGQQPDEGDMEAILSLKKKYKLIGSACIITRRKGLHQAIKALPLLPGFALIIIGEGPEKQSLEALARQYKVGDRCLFLGKRPNAFRYYPLFDLYLMASYSEGLPLALLEAAACKLPALCSAITIHQELFTDKEVGFFALDDTDSFTRGVAQVMDHYDTFAKRIYTKYLECYTPQRMAETYLSLYRELKKKY